MRDFGSGEGLSDTETDHRFAMYVDEDPLTFYGAVHNIKWCLAMDSKIAAIRKNNTWELIDLPKGGKSVRVKWVYKTNLNEHGEIDKYKTQLVAKGYTQQHGVDYS